MKAYIFGASKAGKECYKKVNKFCNILGFIDNDSKKWGKYIDEMIEIFPPKLLKQDENYDFIIIASMYTWEISKQLQEMNINNFIVLPLNVEDIIHPNFKVYIDYLRKALEFFEKIKNLQSNIDNISISEYNKRYLSEKRLDELFLYADILWNTYKYQGSSNNLLDYGGGNGLLGMFAKYLGVENVYYNDIYDISCKDAQVMAKELNVKLDGFILGDIDQVIEFSLLNNIYFDTIVSYEVLEHIYDLDNFFKKLPEVCERNCFVSMWSGANSYNDGIVESLKLFHFKAEYLGFEKLFGWKERDSIKPFTKIRENIIREFITDYNIDEIDIIKLVKDTKGMEKVDILKHLNYFLENKTHQLVKVDKYTTNTCDPLTGNWAEHLIDFDELQSKIYTFENVYILPNDKKTSNVIGFCLQDKAYSNILEEYIEDQDRKIFRLDNYYDVIIKWMNKISEGKSVSNWLIEKEIEEIIIYGAGEIGKLLYMNIIKDKIIKVKYICDNNKNSKHFIDCVKEVDIINFEELNIKHGKTNNIIVSPIHAYDKICTSINKDNKYNMINLRTIIEEM